MTDFNINCATAQTMTSYWLLQYECGVIRCSHKPETYKQLTRGPEGLTTAPILRKECKKGSVEERSISDTLSDATQGPSQRTLHCAKK